METLASEGQGSRSSEVDYQCLAWAPEQRLEVMGHIFVSSDYWDIIHVFMMERDTRGKSAHFLKILLFPLNMQLPLQVSLFTWNLFL